MKKTNNELGKKQNFYQSPCCEVCRLSDLDILTTSSGLRLTDSGSGEDWVMIFR